MIRILVLMTTTTYKAHLFFDAASKLGVSLSVGTDRPQVLSGENPAGSLTLDFLEPEVAARQIVDFNRRFPFQSIVAADDDGVVLAALASEALGLPHNPVQAVVATRNKLRMRQLLERADLSSPAYQTCSIEDDPAQVACRILFPCVVKPLFLSGSRGVIRADDPQEFAAAFHRAAAILRLPEVAALGGDLAGRLLIEGFIPGREVAVEGLLRKGELLPLALFDKPDPLDGPFFEETIYVTPSRLPEPLQEVIIECAGTAASALGLREGPVHAELRLNDGCPWLVEIAPRTIGGLCSRTLRFGDGISLEELVLRHAAGLDVAGVEREKLAAGVMMIPTPGAGILKEVLGKEEAEQVTGIEEIRISLPIGQKVTPLPEGSKYLGFIFARDESPENVEAALRESHQMLSLVIDPNE